jgi:hypothetical protein
MKKIALVVLLALCLAIPAYAGVLMYTVSVDQATKLYFGSDLVNYTLIPANTFRTVYAAGAGVSQITFGQASSAKTAAPNVRVEYMGTTGIVPVLSKDREGQKLQTIRPDAVGNYFLTKSTTVVFN